MLMNDRSFMPFYIASVKSFFIVVNLMSRPKNPTRLQDVGLSALVKRGYHGTGIKDRPGQFILETAVTDAKPQRSQRKPNSYRHMQFQPFGERLRLHKILFLLRCVVVLLRELLFIG